MTRTPGGRRGGCGAERVGVRTLLVASSLLVLAVVIRLALAAGTVTLYVDDNSTCTTGCGTQAAPYPTIQAAINDADSQTTAGTISGATIQVAAGNYPERIYIFPHIHVVCAGPSVTTINATGKGRSAVILAGGLVPPATRPRVDFSIEGCTITGGVGENRTLELRISGGGVYILGDAVVSNNVITGNVMSGPQTDFVGAGVYVGYGNPIIIGNTITRNVADPPPASGNNDSRAYGAGVFIEGHGVGVVFTHVRVEGNTISENGALGEVGRGGGLRVDATPEPMPANRTAVRRNIIMGNRSAFTAGGMEIYGEIVVTDNLLYGNSALMQGGGLNVYQAAATITNNTIIGNVLTQTRTPSGSSYATYGAGISVDALISQSSDPQVTITNNLIVGNTVTSTGRGAGLNSHQTSPIISYTDFWGNLKLPSTTSNLAGDFTDAQVIGLRGNLAVDPRFVRAPQLTDVTVAAGTTTTAAVLAANRYLVNQVLEYNNDGVARTITAVNNTSNVVTFTPALTAASQAFKLLANWGTTTNMTEDFRLQPTSPVIEAGINDSSVSTLDLGFQPRIQDANADGQAIVDMGAYELPGDTDMDGVLDIQDCAPLVSSVQTSPGPIGPVLRLAMPPASMSWPRIPQSNVYDVYRGSIPAAMMGSRLPGSAYDHACFEGGSPDRASLDPSTPPPGSAYYYLVGGVNFCGDGCLGLESPPAACEIPTPNRCPTTTLDTDADTVLDINDNCPMRSNTGQADADKDGVGDACDNCPALSNPDQADGDNNGVGNLCQDSDQDGYTYSFDCNDQNAAIHPGAIEVCNGVDDDCDAAVDEDLGTRNCGTGACLRTVAICVNGVPQTCTPGTPGTETCNGIDDDCDDAVDDNLGTLSCGTGACASTVSACENGQPNICTPGAPGTETCNNIDDDCDGAVDDNLGTQSCGTGACASTVIACVNGQPNVCTPGTPGTETCNTIDDDCDGAVDEGFDLDLDGFTSCNGDCNDGAATTYPGAPEICNGADDNCNLVADEGYLDSDRDAIADCVDPDDDNDLVADVSDCAPLINSVSAIPGEVPPQLVQVAGAAPGTYAWAPVVQANVHNVHRYQWDGRTGQWSDIEACLVSETPQRSFVDAAVPPVGSFFYYVITGTNRCGEGTAGASTSGVPRPLVSACAPQNRDSDLDLVLDRDDNCPLAANALQADADHDGRGDVCDNCPVTSNPGQEDSDANGVGDACQS